MKLNFKPIVFLVALSFIAPWSAAQEIDHTQYYLNLPGVNPAFTGMEEYLDLRFSHRQGFNDFAVKNNYSFVSGYTTLNKSARTALTNNAPRMSNPAGFEKLQQSRRLLRKHGIGGMVTTRTYGPYQATSINLNYAYHLPIAKNVTMSFGTKAGYFNERISPDGLTVREANDAFYQQVLATSQGNSSKFLLDFGYTLYTKNFYFGLSSMNLVSNHVNGNETLDLQQPTRFSAQLGVISIPIGEDFSVNPGARVLYSSGYPVVVSGYARIRFRDLVYVGGGYTSSNPKLSLLFGLRLNGSFSVNYAYDKYLSDLNNFNITVHEIVLGMAMFNRFQIKSHLW